MTPEQLRAKFPNASQSFLERNGLLAKQKADKLKANNDHPIDHTIRPSKPEPVDGKEIREAQPDEGVGKAARLVAVKITFRADHGQQLDDDNREYAGAKPILDALHNLGLLGSDKEIRCQVVQRMDNH